MELESPGIFGPQGGHSRAVLISRMSWTLGAFVGPILSGFLTETAGYYEMNCALGKSSFFLHWDASMRIGSNHRQPGCASFAFSSPRGI